MFPTTASKGTAAAVLAEFTLPAILSTVITKLPALDLLLAKGTAKHTEGIARLEPSPKEGTGNAPVTTRAKTNRSDKKDIDRGGTVATTWTEGDRKNEPVRGTRSPRIGRRIFSIAPAKGKRARGTSPEEGDERHGRRQRWQTEAGGRRHGRQQGDRISRVLYAGNDKRNHAPQGRAEADREAEDGRGVESDEKGDTGGEARTRQRGICGRR